MRFAAQAAGGKVLYFQQNVSEFQWKDKKLLSEAKQTPLPMLL